MEYIVKFLSTSTAILLLAGITSQSAMAIPMYGPRSILIQTKLIERQCLETKEQEACEQLEFCSWKTDECGLEREKLSKALFHHAMLKAGAITIAFTGTLFLLHYFF